MWTHGKAMTERESTDVTTDMENGPRTHTL